MSSSSFSLSSRSWVYADYFLCNKFDFFFFFSELGKSLVLPIFYSENFQQCRRSPLKKEEHKRPTHAYSSTCAYAASKTLQLLLRNVLFNIPPAPFLHLLIASRLFLCNIYLVSFSSFFFFSIFSNQFCVAFTRFFSVHRSKNYSSPKEFFFLSLFFVVFKKCPLFFPVIQFI